jgi:hypothetical protein
MINGVFLRLQQDTLKQSRVNRRRRYGQKVPNGSMIAYTLKTLFVIKKHLMIDMPDGDYYIQHFSNQPRSYSMRLPILGFLVFEIDRRHWTVEAVVL